MAKYGSASAVVIIDDHGGTPRTVTSHVRKLGGIKIAQITEENSPFGMANERNMPVGKQKAGPVTMEGDYDDTATIGPHVVFSTLETLPTDSSRTLDISPDGTKHYGGECYAVDYELSFTDGKLTGYKVQLVQAGAFAWT